jgi:hypothetical protein
MRTLLLMLNPEMLARQESCRQEVAGEVLIQKLFANQELDDPTPKYLDHRLEPRERDERKCTLLIKTTLENDGVEMRFEPQLVAECLVRDDHTGKDLSARRLSVTR